MKVFLRKIQGRVKTIFNFIKELANGASYAMHR